MDANSRCRLARDPALLGASISTVLAHMYVHPFSAFPCHLLFFFGGGGGGNQAFIRKLVEGARLRDTVGGVVFLFFFGLIIYL